MRVTVALSRKDRNKVFTVDFALKNKSMPINLLMSLDID